MKNETINPELLPSSLLSITACILYEQKLLVNKFPIIHSFIRIGGSITQAIY